LPTSKPPSPPRGIQSVEVGGQLLRALADHGRPLALKDLAAAAGMPPAKAHPYLVSYGRLGLVEREAETGRYGLGPLALQMGLIALHQYDPVRLATPLIESLAHETGQTCAIAVWGHRGPTIVRVAEAPTPVHVSLSHGAVMSLTGTASGRLFVAFGPHEAVRQALKAEPGARPAARPRAGSKRAAPAASAGASAGFGRGPVFDEAIDAVRRAGLAGVDGLVVPGIRAMAAPVFDARGALVIGLTAVGPAATFDLAPHGALALALRRAADGLSARLGWRRDEAAAHNRP
jgi:DNA-binding IclR family transcriptional regulator